MSRKLALIIGNSHYQDPNLAKLVAPGEDVIDLTEVLRDVAIGGFDQVIPLINETDAAIRLSIEDFFADKKPDDLLVIYFSGHGVRDEQGQLYLAVNNTRANRLRATAIPAEFITREMDRSRSKRQVLILDCCHSGAFAQGAKAVTGESAGTGPAFEGSGYGRVVLTATDATQYAWEGDKIIGEADNSLFTHFMVEGLRTGAADIDGDGQITLDEMYEYIYERVITRTPKQTPGKWSYKQQGDIVIARSPCPFVQLTELPSDLKVAIDSSLVNVRLGAVRELDRLLNGSNTGLVLAASEALKHLAEDDSRSVSSTASSALQTYTDKQRTREAQQRLTQEQAETERRAALKTEQDRIAAENVRQEQLARAAAERGRIEARLAGSERPAAIQRTAPGDSDRPDLAMPHAGGWSLTLLLALTFGVTWPLAFTLVSQPNYESGSALVALGLAGVLPIGALTISFRRLGLPTNWRHFLTMGVGWLAGFIVAAVVANGAVSSPLHSVDSAWKFGALFGAICGTSAGIVTGLTVRQLMSGLGSINLRSITPGWAIAWATGFGWFSAWAAASGALRTPYSNSALTQAALYIGLTGAFIGALGGGLTYWQIARSRRIP